MYHATICQSVPLLYNLTDSTFYTYASDGSVLTYEPLQQSLPDYRLNVFYAVDQDMYLTAVESGRYTHDLVKIVKKSQGRDGVEVVELRLYDDLNKRVYPVSRMYHNN